MKNGIWLLISVLFFANMILNHYSDRLVDAIHANEIEKVKLEKDIECLESKLQEPVEEVPVQMITPVQTWEGQASYYSEDGCVGCREDRLMANGERFNEDAMTLAFNWLPLNTQVRVVNLRTGESRLAIITDTGGFNELGRIADLSKGLKEAIGCTDLCEVAVREIR